jgi:hypothetical protein
MRNYASIIIICGYLGGVSEMPLLILRESVCGMYVTIMRYIEDHLLGDR